ncbi:M3 family metallopeptidase [Dyadobacter chenwenxiniae]|uniref:oligopeptidase A n=1 Tax=Dyadobacter chenwenxiniae TaxID=2906456 RepID=A0A9X1TKD9_9BACT|nr:M3 family metallopeptidase [Dyadobacter chenwenxiniae]MCF0061153.1 M3 family metallopeptidase [Dyadobacter chenwenxiniae]UON80980.1 M3 family metallopeptidase [Dyadobacter chenwenxiniae]
MPQQASNPFLAPYNTPFQVPPFDKVEPQHFLPAFEQGMAEQQNSIAAILSNEAEPTFENTIEALEYTSDLLTRVSSVFFNLASANTNAEIEALSKEIAPKLSQHSDDIFLNPALFQRVKKVNDSQENLELHAAQRRLLEKTYKAFVRSGANLSDSEQAKIRDINKQLSVLTVRFAQNLLAETNQFELIISDESQLSGLPESIKMNAAQLAKDAAKDGNWKFTLHQPSIMPFLQHADDRSLRETIYKAYISRCNHNDDLDNKEIVAQIAALRAERASLLGYDCHADYVLEESMAKKITNVLDLLHRLWEAALPVAKSEALQMQELMNREGRTDELEAWDWFYYADKVRKEKYNYDTEQLKPYFQLTNVRDGIFEVVKNLYGLTFTEIKNIPTYHEDVITYEVREANGDLTGIFYMDFFTRNSKRGGAWMTSYRKQRMKNGQRIAPVVSIVCNYAKPTGENPVLLTAEEVETFFHEFGHALHGLLSNVEFETLSGTSVPRDFVELPSQIMEHWAFEPEVLKRYAKHYQTGETIPGEAVTKMKAASTFNQGFATIEYLAAAFLDLFYHIAPAGMQINPQAVEEKAMADRGLIKQIAPRYRSTYFQHIFAGGYSAGYYSYIWSEVLDSDAFAAFKETGNIFDPATALSFRKNILEKGGTEEPLTLYKSFRGRTPKEQYLLENRGLTKLA